MTRSSRSSGRSPSPNPGLRPRRSGRSGSRGAPGGADRREPASRPGPLAVAGTAAAAVVALAVLSPIVVQQVRGSPPTGRCAGPGGRGPAQRPQPGRRAVRRGAPAGRPADGLAECQAYDAPVRDENAVHDLDNGRRGSPRPALADADVTALEGVPDNGLLSPYDGLPSPVVVTVWGRQLRLTGADDPRLPLSVAAFGDGHTSPEPSPPAPAASPATPHPRLPTRLEARPGTWGHSQRGDRTVGGTLHVPTGHLAGLPRR